MTVQPQKPFTCFNCKKEIKLQRKDDDSGWLRFEADGVTIHNCQQKKRQPPQQNNNNDNDYNEIKELLHQILRRQEYLQTLITQAK